MCRPRAPRSLCLPVLSTSSPAKELASARMREREKGSIRSCGKLRDADHRRPTNALSALFLRCQGRVAPKRTAPRHEFEISPFAHLYPILWKIGFQRQHFPRVNIRIMSIFESLFQLLQLVRREDRPVETVCFSHF